MSRDDVTTPHSPYYTVYSPSPPAIRCTFQSRQYQYNIVNTAVHHPSPIFRKVNRLNIIIYTLAKWHNKRWHKVILDSIVVWQKRDPVGLLEPSSPNPDLEGAIPLVMEGLATQFGSWLKRSSDNWLYTTLILDAEKWLYFRFFAQRTGFCMVRKKVNSNICLRWTMQVKTSWHAWL